MFRGTVTDKADRSYMNICFVMNDEYKDLEADFLKFATEKGMVGIKGHRSSAHHGLSAGWFARGHRRRAQARISQGCS